MENYLRKVPSHISGDAIVLSDDSPEKMPSKKDSKCTVPKGVNPDEAPIESVEIPCQSSYSLERVVGLKHSDT